MTRIAAGVGQRGASEADVDPREPGEERRCILGDLAAIRILDRANLSGARRDAVLPHEHGLRVSVPLGISLAPQRQHPCLDLLDGDAADDRGRKPAIAGLTYTDLDALLTVVITILIAHEDEHVAASFLGLVHQPEDVSSLGLRVFSGLELPDPLPHAGIDHRELGLRRLPEESLDDTDVRRFASILRLVIPVTQIVRALAAQEHSHGASRP